MSSRSRTRPQPIATAPRNGDTVLLGMKSGYGPPHNFNWQSGYWRADREAWVDMGSNRISDSQPEPIVWLPQPPAATELDVLMAEAQAAMDRLTPAQQKKMWEEQRQSWPRQDLD